MIRLLISLACHRNEFFFEGASGWEVEFIGSYCMDI